MSADTGAPVLLWFRRDLRLADNPALAAAIDTGRPVVPVYVRDDEDAGDRAPGGASRWWLHGSLKALADDLASRGSRLILRSGKAADVLDDLLQETGATSVFWNRRYEPWATARDEAIKTSLKERGIAAKSFNAALIREPWEIQTKDGGPYKVFTPFWKALRGLGDPDRPEPAPDRIPAPDALPKTENLDDWKLPPEKPDWAGGLRHTWTPGEKGAQEQLASFVDEAVMAYDDKRNFPGTDGTSRLSPHLHFGEIGPRQVWHAAIAAGMSATGQPMPKGVETFLSEIAWREFSYHLLYHFPTIPKEPLRPEFADFDWKDDAEGLKAWQEGRTGYPIVDAGMRELWATGWMHNRVRMIVASFLVKDLLVHWRDGEAWFWDTLVDADLANNTASWQWVAGSGADAAPYFRVFNPVLQGEKFDPDGTYVRRWVPELKDLSGKAVHAPWTAQPLELKEAGIALGRDYPEPIVDHAVARKRALERYQRMKDGND
ncbi:deoxyribodipyrimidine photo-lyase [Rhodobium orientis]|uniref:Deoxyribodipyrimidine photo-lyase n=1 Tax=Rhodobium orientis TaxID=34017 RepID=A0A327JMP6_9HYPH|nr:deoxyribodipyrimidine photo-lyase [Rhodobium orientis]MBB4301332.1 deoxyribodipyrimidine photo-lyase [Rhodobium orientis]MBK5951080.1 deoxyribodipyrimidine photolyase [Rhodobium orientis]RAI26856.1 deoxyribodipyrimidine photolyase [Rhodobium orientis]